MKRKGRASFARKHMKLKAGNRALPAQAADPGDTREQITSVSSFTGAHRQTGAKHMSKHEENIGKIVLALALESPRDCTVNDEIANLVHFDKPIRAKAQRPRDGSSCWLGPTLTRWRPPNRAGGKYPP